MAGPPTSMQIDGENLAHQKINEQLVLSAKNHLIVNWDESLVTQLSAEQPDTLRFNQQFMMPKIPDVLAWLNTLDFEVCIGASLFSDWRESGADNVLFPGQYPLGWMLALKGNGHNYLVSRRWIERAPVKIHSSPQLTLIQFHDLNTNSSTALSQAKQAWQFFNRQETSGFLGGHSYNKNRFDGQYNPDDGGLYVTVLGREPDLMELKNACYCKNFLQMQDRRPINKIVYLFFDASVAKKWLPELWVRDIECRTFIDGKEVILSNEYVSPTVKNLLW
jgi:hypothetical protein